MSVARCSRSALAPGFRTSLGWAVSVNFDVGSVDTAVGSGHFVKNRPGTPLDPAIASLAAVHFAPS